MNSPATTVEVKLWDDEDDEKFVNRFRNFLKYEFYAEYQGNEWDSPSCVANGIPEWTFLIGEEKIVILAEPHAGLMLQGSETLVAAIIVSAKENNLIK